MRSYKGCMSLNVKRNYICPGKGLCMYVLTLKYKLYVNKYTSVFILYQQTCLHGPWSFLYNLSVAPLYDVWLVVCIPVSRKKDVFVKCLRWNKHFNKF